MHPWLTDGGRVPHRHWTLRDNRLEYLRWLELQLDFVKPEDWYGVTHSDFINNKGDSIYRHVYNNNRMMIVSEIYPQLDWKPWLFFPIPRNTWADPEVVRKYLDWIFEQEGLSDYTDWYSIKRKDLEKYPGSTIFNNKFGGSHRIAIKEFYPEYDWKDWLFIHSPPGFWDNDDNCKEYLEWLRSELNFFDYDDWYRLTQSAIIRHHGHGLHRRFSGSPFRIMLYFYPEYDWKPWLFSRVGNDFWASRENRISYMDWLGEKLDFTEIQNWYSISMKDFSQNNGSGFISHCYGSSPSKAVIDIYQNFDWEPWKFEVCPNGFWDSRAGFVQYMDWLGEHMGYTTAEDWYQIQGSDFEYGGSGMLAHYYEGSPSKAVMDYLPGYDWKEWLFTKASSGFWKDRGNRSKYLDWLGRNLGFKEEADWYALRKTDIVDNHGAGIIPITGTILGLLEDYFPQYDWLPWLMKPAPNSYWKERPNRLRYIRWLESELDISEKDEWYSVDKRAIMQNHGNGILSYWGSSKTRMLEDVYPEHDWDYGRLKKVGKNQQRLTEIVQSLFPDDLVLIEFKHEEMRFSYSNRKMELDIFIPERKIAFEYQGEQHFEESWMDSREDSLQRQESRDEEKRIACEELGIALIEIPFTWDRKEEYVKEILSVMDIDWG